MILKCVKCGEVLPQTHYRIPPILVAHAIACDNCLRLVKTERDKHDPDWPHNWHGGWKKESGGYWEYSEPSVKRHD